MVGPILFDKGSSHYTQTLLNQRQDYEPLETTTNHTAWGVLDPELQLRSPQKVKDLFVGRIHLAVSWRLELVMGVILQECCFFPVFQSFLVDLLCF